MNSFFDGYVHSQTTLKEFVDQFDCALMKMVERETNSDFDCFNRKSPVGKILLSAKQDDNKVIIDVVDDGQGFNLEKIKDRAVSRGFLTQDRHVQDLHGLQHPGF